jgi:hypothetical protein
MHRIARNILLSVLCMAATGFAQEAQPTTQPKPAPAAPAPTAKPTPEAPAQPASVAPKPLPGVDGPQLHKEEKPSAPTPGVAPIQPTAPAATSAQEPPTAQLDSYARAVEMLRDPAWWRSQLGLTIVRGNKGEAVYVLAPGGIFAVPASMPPPTAAFQHRQILMNERPATAALLAPRVFAANRRAFYPRLVPAWKQADARPRTTGPRTIGTQPALTPRVGSSFSPGASLR